MKAIGKAKNLFQKSHKKVEEKEILENQYKTTKRDQKIKENQLIKMIADE